eukprot:UN14858
MLADFQFSSSSTADESCARHSALREKFTLSQRRSAPLPYTRENHPSTFRLFVYYT